MPEIEVSLPDRIDSEISRIAEEGEFVSREQAIEELLSTGLSAYKTTESSPEQARGDWDTQAAGAEQDPAMEDEFGDGPTF